VVCVYSSPFDRIMHLWCVCTHHHSINSCTCGVSVCITIRSTHALVVCVYASPFDQLVHLWCVFTHHHSINSCTCSVWLRITIQSTHAPVVCAYASPFDQLKHLWCVCTHCCCGSPSCIPPFDHSCTCGVFVRIAAAVATS